MNKKELSKNKFCLLDTNFVSILAKSKLVGKEKEKETSKELLLKHINPADNIICITWQTIKEISKNDEVYSGFKIFSDSFPFHVLYQFDYIINLEMQKNDIKREDLIEIPTSGSTGFSLLDVLNDEDFVHRLKNTKESDPGIAKDMLETHKRYIRMSGSQRIKREKILENTKRSIAKKCGVDEKDVTHKNYPARLMLIESQIFKICNASRAYNEQKALSDSNDIMIYTSSPYMDKIFAEGNQAELLNQFVHQGELNPKIDIYKFSGHRVIKCKKLF